MKTTGLFVAVIAALVLPGVASPAAGVERQQIQVEIEARIVPLRPGQLRDFGIQPGITSAQLRCDPGEVALGAGASVNELGVSVFSSLPTGPRTYRLELGNFNLTEVTASLSALCAQEIGAAPRLRVGTGTVAVTVPAAQVSKAGLVPGTTRITGTCTKDGVPVSSGVDLGNEGVLSIAESYPSGPRKLVVVVRNHVLEAQQALVAVRCLELPDGFGVTRLTIPVTIAPATGEGASLEPGETEGTKKCPPGKVLIGGGHRAPDDTFTDTFPTIRGIPALGYLFRNFSREQQSGNLAIFCTPRIVRTSD